MQNFPNSIELVKEIMRLVASVKENSKVKRVMLFERDQQGCYLFLYNTLQDSPCFADYWYENVAQAKEDCKVDYGVVDTDWLPIPDPLPDCQDDWIAQVRVKGCNIGKPEFGTFEKLVNGNWIEIR